MDLWDEIHGMGLTGRCERGDEWMEWEKFDGVKEYLKARRDEKED